LPLVYGYGLKGNLARLIKFVRLGIPLPLSLVKNQRSMVGMDNLVDLLIRCIDHPEASGKTFLVSDGEDLSTPELIKLIASSMGRKANLFPFPISMLKFLASVLGKREEINRLVGSLRIDNSYTKKILNWTPPVSVEEGIRRMVQGK
jgi:nucleoside-diphosphate-sugar epimerase